MISVLAQIESWAAQIERWERAALKMLMSGEVIEDHDIDYLVGMLLRDAGIAESPSEADQVELQFTDINDGDARASCVLRIFDLRNVNALAENQVLEFSPGLTAIFGENASGKSGYARVLANAGFTRGDRHVLPNVTQEGEEAAPVASIEFLVDGDRRIEESIAGERISELSSVYVFDSTSVSIHLTGKNNFSFSPAGLELLTELAELTDRVRSRLSEEVERRGQVKDFASYFHGDSPVREIMKGLSHRTDEDAIRQLADLSSDEESRISTLEFAIAELKVADSKKELETLKETRDDLIDLLVSVRGVADQLSSDRLEALGNLRDDLEKRKTSVRTIGADNFSAPGLRHVGGEEWLKFLEAAKSWAEIEVEKDKSLPYPRPKDPCLLCQQELTDEAEALIRSLWAYLEQEVEGDLSTLESRMAEEREDLRTIDPAQFEETNARVRHLRERDDLKPEELTIFSEQVLSARKHFLEVADGMTAIDLAEAIDRSPTSELQEIIDGLQSEIDQLGKSDKMAEMRALEEELTCLQHREQLAGILEDVSAHLKDLEWSNKVAKVGGSTAHITREYNMLFTELVSNRYLDLFDETLRQLERRLDVEVDVSGKKGATVKQITLSHIAEDKVEIATPESVLSEGEKRAVALADFLTEVALDETCTTIVLDDPVTSLDMSWRETIAEILCGEATSRQVIVFTHDLPFLYFISRGVERAGVDARFHWITRDGGSEPGYVYLDNSPALEKGYKTSHIPWQCYKSAKDSTSAEERDRWIRSGFGALRTCYEALIIFEVLNEVVLRFGERISFGRLNGLLTDGELIQEIVEKCEGLSTLIEAHLHPDAIGRIPSLGELKDEIEGFDDIRSRVKNAKK